MSILLIYRMNKEGKREVLALEPMLEDSKECYRELFSELKYQGLRRPPLMVSNTHKGLAEAISECFPGTSWQRCNIRFMRNILMHVPHREKGNFVRLLKGVWLTADLKTD